MNAQIPVNVAFDKIKLFCNRWDIARLELFGSITRSDFGPDSDIDVLVTFHDAARWSLFDVAAMELELEVLFGRKTDLVLREAIEISKNPFRKDQILGSAQLLSAA